MGFIKVRLKDKILLDLKYSMRFGYIGSRRSLSVKGTRGRKAKMAVAQAFLQFA